MRNSTLLCRRDLLWIALRLDILTRIFGRILNKHLCSLCDPWIIRVWSVDYLSSEFRRI